MFEKPGVTVGEGDQPIVLVESRQGRFDVRERGELLPALQEGGDFLWRGLEAVQAEGVDESAAHGLQVTAVPERHDRVLELLETLAVAPCLPEIVC